MKMTPRNIVIVIVAALLGVFLGSRFPLFGLIALVGGLGFAAYVLLANKQGTKVDDATRQNALGMTPAEGMSRIYVARRGFMGGMQGMNISIDGDAWKGQIRSGFFMMAEVAPGTHSLSAKFNAQTEGTRRNHEVTLAAGECVLLEMGFDMGALQGSINFGEQRDKRSIVAELGARKMIGWLSTPAG